MTYDQILTLDSIVKYGSFKAAAEVLHKSQPSLSMAIKKLEEEFDIQIFDRSEYRPKLTEAGRIFYQKAIISLESFRELEQTATQLGAGFETSINICVEAIFPIQRVAPLLEKFFDPHIHISLNLNIDVLDGVMNKLINHEVDFALGPMLATSGALEAVKVGEVEVIPVVSNKFSNIDLKTLKTLPQIVVESSVPEARGAVFGGLGRQYWYTSDLYMKEQLITAGLGWGRLPLHQAAHLLESEKLTEIKNIKEVKKQIVPMYLSKMKDKILGRNTQNLWNYISESS